MYDAFRTRSNQTAVSSNSWGPDEYTRLRPQDAMEKSVIEEQLAMGYNEKGLVYVFAAGNKRVVTVAEVLPRILSEVSEDMASYEERLNHRGVIPVCAVHSQDEYASYSNAGTNLWICAPAGDGVEIDIEERTPGRNFFTPTYYGMTTTDLTGHAGANKGTPPPAIGDAIEFSDIIAHHLQFGSGGFWIGLVDDPNSQPSPVVHPYTPNIYSDEECRTRRNGCYLEIYKQPGDSSYRRFFSGTSAATPVVSGVIGLLRAAYPLLTWRDIKLILAESAEQVDSLGGSWQTGAATYHDGATSYTHSIDYGFGLIDATKAMELADEWALLPTEEMYNTDKQESMITVGTSSLQVEVPNDTNISFIEFVQLDINSTEADVSELSIELKSPQGVNSLFMRPHACALAVDETACQDLEEVFTFASAAHLGANPTGTWVLDIKGATNEVPVQWHLRFLRTLNAPIVNIEERRVAGVVERGGLENRCTFFEVSRVRIPHSSCLWSSNNFFIMIKIWTDGACSGNPGPGGWAAVILSDEERKVLKGREPHTTNNRMELLAPIRALETLRPAQDITIYTDSQYVVRGMTEWLQVWQKRGWLNSAREPVKNKDLWLRLVDLAEQHRIDWHWIKGHSGHIYNEAVDAIAQAEMREYQQESEDW